MRGPSRARLGGEGPCSLPLAADTAQSGMEETHVQTVCVLSRARPCRRGLLPPSRCPALPTAPWPRHTHGRCAAKPARPGGEGPCSLPLAARLSRVQHGRDTCTGGARPGPGETWQGGTLLPPSRCSAQPTAPRPRHTHKAVRGASRARPGGGGPCSLPYRCQQSRQRHGRDARTGGARPGPGEIRRGRALLSPSCCSALACCVSAVTHAQAVRSPSRARPGAGRLCFLPLAARRARHS